MPVAVDENGIVVGGRGGNEGVQCRQSLGGRFSQSDRSQDDRFIDWENPVKQLAIGFQNLMELRR